MERSPDVLSEKSKLRNSRCGINMFYFVKYIKLLML